LIELKPQFLVDIIDILIVAFLFYRLADHTRAAQMFVGLVSSGSPRSSPSLRLSALNSIIGSPDRLGDPVRHPLPLNCARPHPGPNRLLRALIRVGDGGVLKEILGAVEDMSKERRGAIIVVERDMGLRDYIETGTKLDAAVTKELLETIFTPHSPLHDGAVVIRGDQIAAAGCILPLSQTPGLSPILGTRHRAALAARDGRVRVHRSEETGAISIAHKGELKWNLDEGQLRSELAAIFNPRPEETAEVEKEAPQGA
jgi:diadenylate cyclase